MVFVFFFLFFFSFFGGGGGGGRLSFAFLDFRLVRSFSDRIRWDWIGLDLNGVLA